MNPDQQEYLKLLKTKLALRQGRFQLSEQSMICLSEQAERLYCDKNTYLQQQGKHSKWLYVVTEGILREHELREDGKDVTSEFHVGPAGAGSFESYVSNNPCDYSISTVTDATIFRITCAAFYELITKHADLCFWYAGLIRTNYVNLRRRALTMNCTSSEHRLRELIERSPELIEAVPSIHLATYLSMTPVNFSRAKSRILKERKDLEMSL